MIVVPTDYDDKLTLRWYYNWNPDVPRRDHDVTGYDELLYVLGHFRAEIAVEHYLLGVPYDQMKERFIVGEDVEGHDFDLPDGRTGQVKWNSYRPPTGKLYHEPGKPFKADVIFLAVDGPPLRTHDRELEIVGWTDQETWHANKYLGTFGHNPDVPMMKPELLWPVERLLAELRTT